jgi:hypothetical protein
VRAYFTFPRFAVSLPWWLALPAYFLWLTAAIVWWMLVAGWLAAILGVALAVRLWRDYGPISTPGSSRWTRRRS